MNNVNSQRISDLVSEMRSLDTLFLVSGAQENKYRFGPTLSEHALMMLEEKYSIHLPQDYRNFLKNIGNGGVGPYYGLHSIEKGMSGHISKPFPWATSNSVNQNILDQLANDENYGYPIEPPGAITLWDEGGGYTGFLVVNGKPNFVWHDFQTADVGYVSTGQTFSEFYLNWAERIVKNLKDAAILQQVQLGDHPDKLYDLFGKERVRWNHGNGFYTLQFNEPIQFEFDVNHKLVRVRTSLLQ